MKARSIKLDELKWSRAYEKSNPSDMLKVKKVLDENLEKSRVLFIGARLEPGDVHQPHYHKYETVLVYGLRGTAIATIDGSDIEVGPDTFVYIPPMAVHRFANISNEIWECVAMAIGPKDSRLENVWINPP
jgi:quercetin dioxygenase-like cupin family protein